MHRAALSTLTLILILWHDSAFTAEALDVKRPSLVFTQTTLGHKFRCAHEALTKAYRQLNYNVKFQTLPNKRALKEASNGNTDGEMLRVEGLDFQFPDLIRVPVALCAVESVVLAKANVKATTFDQLFHYQIGITSGFVDQERLAKQYSLNVTKVHQNEILVKALFKNRVDAIFLTIKEAQKIVNDNAGKYKIIASLNRDVYLYHYLHNKHASLVPAITEQLQIMEQTKQINLKNILN